MNSSLTLGPAWAKIHQGRAVSAAVVGKHTTSWRLEGRSKAIHHGEVFAIIAAHLDKDATEIHSDHLNAVRIINAGESFPQGKFSKMNGRSLYKWLFDIRKRRKVPIHHVKSHTKSRDTASLLNEKADKAAEHAMKYGAMILPEPTFQMDKFMLYSPIDSYIEGNIQRFISHMLAQAEAEAIGAGGNIRMAERLFQNFDPPKSTYIRSPSGYSVSVQLLARSGQLDTMFRRWKRNMKQDNEGRCEFGCQSLQDDHHIFVECPNFQHMRDETKAVLKRVTKSEGEKRGMDAGALAPFISRAESLVTDGDVWPFSESLYYVGRIPDMSTLRADQNGHKDWEWKTRISTVWHVECIKLAGRIWGTVMRDRDKRWWDGKNPRGVA